MRPAWTDRHDEDAAVAAVVVAEVSGAVLLPPSPLIPKHATKSQKHPTTIPFYDQFKPASSILSWTTFSKIRIN